MLNRKRTAWLAAVGVIAVIALVWAVGSVSRTAAGHALRLAQAGESAQSGQSPNAHPSGPTPPPNAQRPTPQRVEPADLAKQLSGNAKPTIVCVSSRELYEKGHIPGAVFRGAASTTKDLNDMRKWAEGLPKTANIVLYCGCCPAKECPNIRPALMAFRQMGFTHVQVLWLEQDFQTDWAAKGYPVEKGK
jgi:thiosulfate/3-mercaptopyruvate sulfurtransferase